MKRFQLPFLAIALLLLLTACGRNAAPPANPPAGGDQAGGQAPSSGQAPNTAPAGGNATYDAAAAQTLFKNNCASCHGQNLEGMVGPNLTKVGSRYSRDQIADILANGKGQMPAGLVKGADADTLAAWLADKK